MDASGPYLRVIASAGAAVALLLAAFALPSRATALTRSPGVELPPCPPSTLLTSTLHQRLGRATAHLARIGSITSAGFGPAPTGAPRHATSQYERTCTYARGTSTPVTVSFVAPVTSAEFTAERTALGRSSHMVVLRELGTQAWASGANGLAFVLKGTVDVLISAPAASLATVAALAREVG